MVGGFDVRQRHAGQPGMRFTPLPKERQVQAVSFLNREAFMPLQFALRADILLLMEGQGSIDRISGHQRAVLQDLLSPKRVRRIVEQAALNGAVAYMPEDLLADVRKGVWQELAVRPVLIDVHRRSIQRGHIDLLAQQVGDVENRDEVSALYRGELAILDAEIQRALSGARDRMSRLHLEDMQAQIRQVLSRN